MLAAARARAQATGSLQALYAEISPPAAGSGNGGLSIGDDNTIASYLRGFWAMDTTYRKFVEDKVGDLEKEVRQAIISAREEARQADGRFGKWAEDGSAKFADAKTELAAENKLLETAESDEGALSKALGLSVKDIPAVSQALDGAGGSLGKLADFAADVPVLDVLAAGASTYFNAQQDIADGMPAPVAYSAEAGGSVLSLAAGGATAAGLLALGTPVGWTVAGAGVVAVGVGDLAHNLIDENWGADISKNGVVLGVADGIGHSFAKTGGDVVHLGTGLGHAAEHLWDSVF